MTDKELKLIGEWLNTKGYDIDLKDSFWMEDFVTDHKFRDLAQLMIDYRTDLVKFSLAPVRLSLPSDKDIEEQAYLDPIGERVQKGFIMGAKWLRDEVKGNEA